MNFSEETTLNHFKVKITRQHGDEAFRAVVVEPDRIDANHFLTVSTSFVLHGGGRRETKMTEAPSASYSTYRSIAEVRRIADLLSTTALVMERIHKLGEEYDRKKAKRKKTPV